MPLTRPDSTEYAPYYAGYVSLVPEGNVIDVLANQFDDTDRLLRPLSDDQAAFRYAPGKWSVKEIVAHLSDTERVFATRALHFARGYRASLPGYNQDDYVEQAASDNHPLQALLDEFQTVRRATVTLFRNLPPEAWERRGIADEVGFSVRAIPYIIAGHELHHRTVLQERYLS
ncbi:MAG: DinB family protein [Gemmatimonadales bacterium]